MSLTNVKEANNKGGKKDLGRLEDGTTVARIVQLIDLGIQKEEYEGAEKIVHKVHITFEFPNDLVTIGEEEKPRWLSKSYTVSLHEKSALTALIKAADPDGKATSKGRNLKGLLGLPLMVTVGSTQTGNAKVAQTSRLMKGMTVPELANDPVFFDLDGTDTETFNKFPEWLKDRITTGEDFDDTPFAKAMGGGTMRDDVTNGASDEEDSPF